MAVEIEPNGSLRMIGDGDHAVTANAAIAQAHIRSLTIMKLGLYGLSALFMIAASLLVVFAPAGREAVSSIVAAALFVVAVGSAGFTAFKLKAPFVEASAGTGSDIASLYSDLRSGTKDRAGAGSRSAIEPL